MLDIFKPAPEAKVEEERDFIMGQALESDAYPMVLKYAYLDESKPNEATGNLGGAHNVNFVFDNKGTELKFIEYVTSGKAKGQKTTYTKNGKEFALPGFSKIENFCKMFTGKSLFEQEFAEKGLELWNGKEKVTEMRKVLTDLIKIDMIVGITKSIEDKYGKEGQTVERNEIDKFFFEDGLTALEKNAGKTEPKFYNDWIKAKKGSVKDKRKNKNVKAGSAAASSSVTATAATSLFAKKG